jgi:hypothetical protein
MRFLFNPVESQSCEDEIYLGDGIYLIFKNEAVHIKSSVLCPERMICMDSVILESFVDEVKKRNLIKTVGE